MKGKFEFFDGIFNLFNSTNSNNFKSRMLLHSNSWDSENIECPERLARIYDLCVKDGLDDRCVNLPSREATDDDILKYHTQAKARLNEKMAFL